jgi:hypothetical protein
MADQGAACDRSKVLAASSTRCMVFDHHGKVVA